MQNKIAIFGEVLFDCFPDGYSILGGAPFNVAWHLQALGMQPLFVSRVGDDGLGQEIRRAMQAWGMDDSAVQSDSQYPTGSVAVTLNQGEPQYRILADQAYDFIAAESLTPDLACGMLYHGTLALRHAVSRNALDKIKRQDRCRVFLDVNLRAPWWKIDDVRQSLAAADWVKLNGDELDMLLPGDEPLPQRMNQFGQQFDLQGLVVTLGERGAAAWLADGEVVMVEPKKQVEVVDCVGAGDAFAAILLLGIVETWPLAQTMQRAQEFASALVGQRGATVGERSFYRPFVEAWKL